MSYVCGQIITVTALTASVLGILYVDLGARAEAAKVQPKNVWAKADQILVEPKLENVLASRAEPEKFWRHNVFNCIFSQLLMEFYGT